MSETIVLRRRLYWRGLPVFLGKRAKKHFAKLSFYDIMTITRAIFAI